ncbi:DNA helicase [Gordonia phage Trine]|uniref:DNA helicase n=1 Tax=Gordonia phage Trine TaxID=2201431 RepID=A0A2Z4Q948_9CAUD|nr:DNA helicase [Gordonia phage Trine]AWY06534.1 DNA helicase [Gordonia phage Trine]
MTEPRQLRPYQIEAVDAVQAAWTVHGISRPAVVLPTGTGKSTVIAKLAADARAQGGRVVMLAHRGELLDQMAASVSAVDPSGEPVGIVAAERDEPETAIVAASFQTLAKARRLRSLGHRDVVLVDEAHHAPAKTYRGVLDSLGCFGHATLTCGFTATMVRADEEALGSIWQEVVYEKSLAWAIGEGFLVAPRGKTVVMDDLNQLAKIRNVAGDYNQGKLEEVMAASVDSTVEAILSHAADRAPIVFATGVDHARVLAELLTQRGIPAASVVGSDLRERRQDVYRRFADGQLQALVTVQVLTEGADFPRCDAVVMGRPTRSQSLYSQMVGRALRPYPGKSDALVLDLTGTARDMSLVTLTDLHSEAKTERVAADGSPVEDLAPMEVEEVLEKVPPAERVGIIELEDIDLLSGSDALWQTTKAGVRFLDIQDEYVFLWPADETKDPSDLESGLVRVGHISTKGAKTGGWLANGAMGTLSQAIEAAELYAMRSGRFPSRSAKWRTANTLASEGQLRFARSLGIDGAEAMTKGRVAQEITYRLASRRLDPVA